jgi:D-alanyl-D-alanine carboxypeptidase
MSRPALATILAELGIPAGYGKVPPLPLFAEAGSRVEVGPNIVGRMQTLAPVAASNWAAMQSAAAADGVSLMLVSGFRSFEYQAELIRRKLESGQRIEDILQVNVAPGYSQHHTGRAVDIATPGSKPLLEEFEQTAAFEWLQSNARRFAFALSYPRDNPLGIAYEPWHWYLTTEEDNDQESQHLR